MPVKVNLSGNGVLAPPGGYPLRLWSGGQTMIEGVVGKSVTSVSATLYTEAGTADIHLAIYSPPSTAGGADEGRVEDLDPDDATIVLKAYQADAEEVGQTATTLELDMPTNRTPQTYIVRLWVDNVTGRTEDDEDRDDDDLTSDEPLIPTGVIVTAFEAA